MRDDDCMQELRRLYHRLKVAEAGTRSPHNRYKNGSDPRDLSGQVPAARTQ